jgi:outer membrane protein OmpA-like peptidoglycan-associated protein
MMYRKLLLTLVAICGATMMFAQDVEAQSEPPRKQGVHPYKDIEPINDTLSNWSIFLHGGFNIFDGDFKSEKKHVVGGPSVGLGFEYNFNPTWGIGAEYTFREYNVSGKNNASTAATLLEGHMHQMDAFITFDIFNAWRSQNKKKLFALNLMLGGGVMWYKNGTQYPNQIGWRTDPATGNQYQYIMYQTKNQTPEKMNAYRSYGVFLGGAMFEFNVNRSLTVGARAVYNYFTKDEVDARPRGNNNDAIFDAEIMLRYKIDAVKHSHVRNMLGLEELTMRKMAQDAATNALADMGDREKDTVVIYHRDTIVVVNRIREYEEVALDDYYYVYFDNNEDRIYDQGLSTIQQCANRLMRDANLCIEIVGYCDNTGTDEYNKTLGYRRAANVADEFIGEYGLDSARVKVVGKGIIRGKRSTAAYGPNRRAEIRVMTKAEFEKKYNPTPTNQDIPEGKKVVVEPGISLAKLARKYYSNTNCWVYIFKANMDILPTPNSLRTGMELVIPNLSESQRMISHQQAEEIYEKIKL